MIELLKGRGKFKLGIIGNMVYTQDPIDVYFIIDSDGLNRFSLSLPSQENIIELSDKGRLIIEPQCDEI
jgi:hypothetical protein